jgi:hypothetical protein
VTRTRGSAKAAGTRAETAVARYLAEHVDDRIERRTKTGAKDRGDISGLRVRSQRVVVEVKDVTRLALAEWVNEAQTEAGNDDAMVGLVIHKRRGTTNVGEWYVTTTVADLVRLIGGDA